MKSNEPLKFSKIVSGGQTGVDRAALDLALELGMECGGWCPKGRLAEDGTISTKYPLTETPTEVYAQRTEWNVRDSDGTLVLSKGQPTDGTPLTQECAATYKKPLLSLDLTSTPNKAIFEEWIVANQISVLNIAGPRESFDPGYIYKSSRRFLSILFGHLIE